MDKQLRKCQSSLMISGMGVILFGAWSIAKIVLTAVMLHILVVEIQDLSGFVFAGWADLYRIPFVDITPLSENNLRPV